MHGGGGGGGSFSSFEDPYLQQSLRLSALQLHSPAPPPPPPPLQQQQQQRSVLIPGVVSAPADGPLVPPLWQSLIKLQRNRSSRMTQGAINLTATWYLHYRQLLHALRMWMHRIPQIKLDAPNTIGMFFGRSAEHRFALQTIMLLSQQRSDEAHAQAQRLQVLREQQQQQQGIYSQLPQRRYHQSSGYGSVAYLYVQYKRCQYALSTWRRNISYRRHLRDAYTQLQRSFLAVQQTKAFAAWLICTARSQQLSRAANRVTCNRFQQSTEQAFFAWRHQYERAVLIRTNQIKLLQMRNQEIADFVRAQDSKRVRRSQYSVLKDWALTVKDRKRGRTLARILEKSKIMRFKALAWQHWKLLLSLDIIVNCLKTLWRGYRVRHLLHWREYRYLRWLRPRIPQYLSFRSMWLKRKLFHVLRLYLDLIAHVKATASKELNLLRAMRRFRRHAISCRHHKRAKSRALVGRELHWKKHIFKRLRRACAARKLCFTLDQRTIARLNRRLLRRFQLVCYIRRCLRRAKRKLRDLVLRRLLLAMLQRRHSLQRFRQRELISRRILKRKQWHRFIATCRLLLRLRRFRARSMRLRGRRLFLRWRRKVLRRQWLREHLQHHHRMHRLRKWFRWLRFLSYRNSAEYRQKQKKLRQPGYYDREEVWRMNNQRRVYRAKLLRGLVSLLWRHYFNRLVRYASSRRKFRKADNYFKEINRKQHLYDAFRQLHEVWHRGLRRGGLSRKIRLIGYGSSHRNVYGRSGGGGNSSSSSIGISSSGSAGRRQDHLIDLQNRLRQNLVRSPAQSLLARWLSHWVRRVRRHQRERRSNQSFHEGWRRQRLRSAVRRLFLLLVHRWKLRNKVGRFLKRKYQRKLRIATSGMKNRTRLRVKDYNTLVRFLEKKRRLKRKELFSKLYALCFIRRHQYKVRCVRRLRAAVNEAIRAWRHFAWRRRHGPGVVNVRLMDKKRKQKCYRHLRSAFLRQKHRRERLIGAMDEHFGVYMARRYLRYWCLYTALKQRLRQTARRLVMRPALRFWLTATVAQIKANRIIRIMDKKIGVRIRKECFIRWRAFSVREQRLRIASEEVAYNTMILRKASVLFSWMRIIDNRVSTSKYYAVRTLCGRNLARKCLFHWHKMALISELSTWKSCQAAVKDWMLSAYWSQRQRLALMEASSFCNAYLAQTCLYRLYRRARLRRRFARRRYNAYRLQHLRIYLLHMRRWKARMYFVYRARVLLDPLQQNPSVFNMHRVLMKWYR